MPDETEIFRLDLDTSQIERKAARVEQIVADIKTKRGKGEDVSDLEQSLNKELDSLGQLAQQEKRATTTTEDLVKQKEKLAAAMRMVGSQSSGLVGDLGGVIELVMNGQRAVIGLAGALAALGAVVGVVQHVRAEFQKLREEQERIDQTYQKMKQGFMDTSLAMAETLQKTGTLTDETWQASQSLFKALTARFGRDVARQIAPLAAMEGVSGQEAALAAQLQLMGARFEPGEMREGLAKLSAEKPEAVAAALAQIARLPEEIARQRVVSAEAIPGGLPRSTPEEHVLDYLRERRIPVRGEGGPREAWPADVKRVMELSKELETAQAKMKELGERWGIVRFFDANAERDILLTIAAKKKELAEIGEAAQVIPERMARESAAEMGQVAPPALPPAPVYTQPVTVNVLNEHVGTQINAGTRRFMPRSGDIGAAGLGATYKTGLP